MIAIELFEGGDHNKPAAELVGKIVARAREKGLILLSCGTYYNVIRFLMPVTIPDAQLEKASPSSPSASTNWPKRHGSRAAGASILRVAPAGAMPGRLWLTRPGVSLMTRPSAGLFVCRLL